jgi:hypothetical protein
MKTEYDESMLSESTSLSEDLDEYKKTFAERVLDAQTTAEDDAISIQERTISDVEDAKEKLKNTLVDLDTSMKAELTNEETAFQNRKKTSDIETPNIDEKIHRNATTSLEELLRKLKFPRFNIGGMVDHIAGSIPGKDSIMAALTPGEFVIREPAVRMFGAGLFKSLNNFKLPKFNLGGVVGPIQKDFNNSVQDSVIKHALDLTINGKQQESLFGSPDGISSIINELKLAKQGV